MHDTIIGIINVNYVVIFFFHCRSFCAYSHSYRLSTILDCKLFMCVSTTEVACGIVVLLQLAMEYNHKIVMHVQLSIKKLKRRATPTDIGVNLSS